ncbi:MAG TPA: hypothetical protein VGO93_10655 [Candidatus Xenobia bacterium]|jgi:hypothetical protein
MLTDRARLVSLQALLHDPEAPRRHVEVALETLEADLGRAVQICQYIAARDSDRAPFFDINRIAYVRAWRAVRRMRLACEDIADQVEVRQEGWQTRGMAALESAVADIEALVTLEKEADDAQVAGQSAC